MRTRYQLSVCTCCLLVFLLIVQLISLARSILCPPRKLDSYCTSDRDTAIKHTAQRRAMSSAQAALGIINSLFAPRHGPHLSAPCTCYSCIVPCVSVAGGVRRPLNGAHVQDSNATSSSAIIISVLCSVMSGNGVKEENRAPNILMNTGTFKARRTPSCTGPWRAIRHHHSVR